MNEIYLNDESRQLNTNNTNTNAKCLISNLIGIKVESKNLQSESDENNNNNNKNEELVRIKMNRSRSSSGSRCSSVSVSSSSSSCDRFDLNDASNLNVFFDSLTNRFGSDCDRAKSSLDDDGRENFMFICIGCRRQFDRNVDFLSHVENEHCKQKQHQHMFKLAKEHDNFLRNELTPGVKKHHLNKIVVFLMEKKMKLTFMHKYAQNLLATNEDTALCLEQLNRERKSGKSKKKSREPTNSSFDESSSTHMYENETNLDEFSNSSSSDYSADEITDDQSPYDSNISDETLLFIDYSIIHFNRLISILKELYNLSSINSLPVYNNHESKKKTKKSSFNRACQPTPVKMTVEPARTATPQTPVAKIVQQTSSELTSKLTNKQSNSSIHSRNACKKLKCPKCNWHYKYRETLDIHMREKHSTDLSSTLSQQCVYCIENTPHPRLGRGEQYKCGYKPYRCEICDYSTTTKGNLSIHMQSDKHINNLKEIRENAPSTKNTNDSSSSVSKLAVKSEPDSNADNSDTDSSARYRPNMANNKTTKMTNSKYIGLAKGTCCIFLHRLYTRFFLIFLK